MVEGTMGVEDNKEQEHTDSWATNYRMFSHSLDT